ncbi:MAG: hypothetical protein R3C56_42445 [Pirellulaceae bacterium]
METAAEAATYGLETGAEKQLDGRAIKLIGKAIKEEDRGASCRFSATLRRGNLRQRLATSCGKIRSTATFRVGGAFAKCVRRRERFREVAQERGQTYACLSDGW